MDTASHNTMNLDLRRQLAQNLTAESEAYGYTLSVWGGGAILINQYGTPSIIEIFLYIGGALLAFAVLAAIAFRHLFDELETARQRQFIIASMIRIISTLGSLVLAYFITIATINSWIPSAKGFLFIGFQVTFTYNLFVLSEQATTRVVALITPSAE